MYFLNDYHNEESLLQCHRRGEGTDGAITLPLKIVNLKV